MSTRLVMQFANPVLVAKTVCKEERLVSLAFLGRGGLMAVLWSHLGGIVRNARLENLQMKEAGLALYASLASFQTFRVPPSVKTATREHMRQKRAQSDARNARLAHTLPNLALLQKTCANFVPRALSFMQSTIF